MNSSKVGAPGICTKNAGRWFLAWAYRVAALLKSRHSAHSSVSRMTWKNSGFMGSVYPRRRLG